MCCSCALGVDYSTILLVNSVLKRAVPWAARTVSKHSQVITTTHDPVLARNEAARPYGNICQFKRLDGGLCLVAPYVDVAAVEGSKDPWLCAGELSACLSPPSCSNILILCYLRVCPRDMCAPLIYAYLGRVEVDALYTFAPGTSQLSAVKYPRSVFGVEPGA